MYGLDKTLSTVSKYNECKEGKNTIQLWLIVTTHIMCNPCLIYAGMYRMASANTHIFYLLLIAENISKTSSKKFPTATPNSWFIFHIHLSYFFFSSKSISSFTFLNDQVFPPQILYFLCWFFNFTLNLSNNLFLGFNIF